MLSLRPIATTAIASLLQNIPTQTAEFTIRFATHSFATRAGDAPAHTFIAGRLNRGGRISRGINRIAGGQFGGLIQTSFSELEFNNIDGAIDTLLENVYADGREVRVKSGLRESTTSGRLKVKPFGTFTLAYTARGGPWSFDDRDVLKVRLLDLSSALQDRIQQETYSGTGGINGTDALTGQTRPLAFGRCLNVPAKLIDPNLFIYQINTGSTNAVTAVYDAGISVPFSSDLPSYAALESADVPPGEFATCLLEGCFRLGIAPAGTVTADIRGSDASDGFTDYSDEHGEVMLKILLRHSTLQQSEIDTQSFIDLNTLNDESMGLYLPAGDDSTVEAVLERLAMSCGAVVGQDRSGLYRTFRLDPPTATPSRTFDDRTITDFVRVDLPYVIPWKAWGVAYQRNWTVQTAGDLATGVTQTRRQFLESPHRFAFAQSAEIAIAHRTSGGTSRETLFNAQAPAEAEALRLIGLYGLGRAYYRAAVQGALFGVEIGETVQIRYERYSLAGGKNFVVTAIEDDADAGTTEMFLFG